MSDVANESLSIFRVTVFKQFIGKSDIELLDYIELHLISSIHGQYKGSGNNVKNLFKGTNKMKAKSCFSTNTDPYRAGIEIGESLLEIHPEVIFLFTTIDYNDSPEIVEAIYDVLGADNFVLIGNTGMGFYEFNKVADAGVSALGINSDGSVKWHVVYESGVGNDPYEATKRCMARLNKLCKPNFASSYFLASDFRTDTSKIITALREMATAPVVGGLAGDDDEIKRCFVYANHKVLTDSIAILAMDGPVSCNIHIAHNLQPVGKMGEITEIEGTMVRKIDNIPAMDFIERELGKPLDIVNRGNITIKLKEKKHDVEYKIRSLFLPDDDMKESAVRLLGGVNTGNFAQVCLAFPDKIKQDVKDIADSLDCLSFKPIAALIVSCAGRKRVLAGNIENEVLDIIQSCPSIKALAGYPSFGEFGPVKKGDGYSHALFHNMTFILLLIGETSN